MDKKVLILSASPRKGGNSETLCAEFTRGAEESGNTVEMVRLHGKKMGFCTACYACKKTGKCVQKDDVAEILDKMRRGCGQKVGQVTRKDPTYVCTQEGSNRPETA